MIDQEQKTKIKQVMVLIGDIKNMFYMGSDEWQYLDNVNVQLMQFLDKNKI